MKKNMLFLIWLIVPLFSNAQNLPINYFLDQEELPAAFDNNEESFSSIEKVLDSIVTTRFDLGNEYLHEKWGWEHDELARDIEFFVYRWDNINNTLFHATQREFTYSTDKIITINQRTNNASAPLLNSYKSIEWLDTNGDVTERYYETWDSDMDIWVPTSQNITTVQSDTLIVRYNYSWEESVQAYELSGKSEIRNYDFFYSSSNFNVDANGLFVPSYNIEYTVNPTSDLLELFEHIRYFPDTDEWKVTTRERWDYDIPNLTGHHTKASDWHSLSNGAFSVYDSTTFVMNEEYTRTTGKGFLPINDLDNFVHLYNYEYDYSSNEFLLIQYVDQVIGNNSEPFEVIKNYYSEIEVSSTNPVLFNNEEINIQFPNPAQSNDQLVVSKLPEGIATAQLWVIDQSGRLLQQLDVKIGESYEMQDLGVLGSGVYYVTLFVEGGQRTWKVVGI